MLKNWTDRVERIVLSNKKIKLRKYSVVFLSIFQKKRYLADSISLWGDSLLCCGLWIHERQLWHYFLSIFLRLHICLPSISNTLLVFLLFSSVKIKFKNRKRNRRIQGTNEWRNDICVKLNDKQYHSMASFLKFVIEFPLNAGLNSKTIFS